MKTKFHRIASEKMCDMRQEMPPCHPIPGLEKLFLLFGQSFKKNHFLTCEIVSKP